jgi:hypothetical protein
MTTRLGLRLLEFCLWVLAAAASVILVLAVLSVVTGGGLLRLKFLLFVVGFLAFGLGSLGLQPESPRRDGERITFEHDTETRFDERVQKLPPLQGEWIPMSDRVSRNVKVFVTGVVLLSVSLLLEVAVGVRPA